MESGCLGRSQRWKRRSIRAWSIGSFNGVRLFGPESELWENSKSKLEALASMESGCLGRSQCPTMPCSPVPSAGFNGVRLFGPESARVKGDMGDWAWGASMESGCLGRSQGPARGRDARMGPASMESGCLGRSQPLTPRSCSRTMLLLQWSPAVWAGVRRQLQRRGDRRCGFNGVRLFGPESALLCEELRLQF